MVTMGWLRCGQVHTACLLHSLQLDTGPQPRACPLLHTLHTAPRHPARLSGAAGCPWHLACQPGTNRAPGASAAAPPARCSSTATSRTCCWCSGARGCARCTARRSTASRRPPPAPRTACWSIATSPMARPARCRAPAAPPPRPLQHKDGLRAGTPPQLAPPAAALQRIRRVRQTCETLLPGLACLFLARRRPTTHRRTCPQSRAAANHA